MNAPIPRAEHPRPDFMRDTFVNLNGEWQFAFDDDDAGLRAGWQRPGTALPLRITVPFAYQTRMSGLGPTDETHPILWYRRGFTLPEEMAGRRVLLRFGAVDYRCSVYVNGEMVGGHIGGYTPFALDVTGEPPAKRRVYGARLKLLGRDRFLETVCTFRAEVEAGETVRNLGAALTKRLNDAIEAKEACAR